MEHKICLLNRSGIDKNLGNKFFFEDESHLRRLTTKEMNSYAEEHAFAMKNDYYSNQFFGSIDWVTLLSPSLIMAMANPKNAKNNIAALLLFLLSASLLTIKFVRFPSNTIDYNKKKMGRAKYYILFFLLSVFYPASKALNLFSKHMAKREWERNKSKANGSEMYLYYKRAQA